jgi:opacity protein-like surface antigen
MKSFALAAVLALAVAGTAHAVHVRPIPGAAYLCDYYNYNGLANDPGYSWFNVTLEQLGGELLRGIETFTVSYGPGTDQQKFSLAKPVDFYVGSGFYGTRWEFTVNPGGPQCKNTEVVAAGSVIYFNNCTDGHSRTCIRW